MIMWFHTRLTLSPSLFVFGKNLIVGNPVISYLRHKTITTKVLSYGCYGNTNSEAKSLWPSASNLATTHCREEKRKVFKGAGLQEMISHLHHHHLQRWWQLLRMLERVPCNGHTLEQKQHMIIPPTQQHEGSLTWCIKLNKDILGRIFDDIIEVIRV